MHREIARARHDEMIARARQAELVRQATAVQAAEAGESNAHRRHRPLAAWLVRRPATV